MELTWKQTQFVITFGVSYQKCTVCPWGLMKNLLNMFSFLLKHLDNVFFPVFYNLRSLLGHCCVLHRPDDFVHRCLRASRTKLRPAHWNTLLCGAVVHRVPLKLHLWSLVVHFGEMEQTENTMTYYHFVLECIVLEKNAHWAKREQRWPSCGVGFVTLSWSCKVKW